MADGKEALSPQDAYVVLGPKTLALLGVNDPSSIDVIAPWYRAGGETFCADFRLTKDGETRRLIAKACTKFSPGEAMAEWLQRRKTLGENGVNLPQLVVIDGATIVEEHIPYNFPEAFRHADEVEREQLKAAYLDTYKRIVGAGFSPMSLHDIRSRGLDAVIIDMGSDLGGATPIDSCNLSAAIDAEKSFRNILR